MKFLISTAENLGFFYPAYGIALELVKRGHEVEWLAPKAYEVNITAAGARFVQMPDGFMQVDDNTPADRLQEIQHTRIDVIPMQVQTYQSILEKFQADLLLVDDNIHGAHCMRDLTGLAFASLGAMPLFTQDPEIPLQGTGLAPATGSIGRWFNRTCHKITKWVDSSALTDALNRQRERLGLSLLPAGISFLDITHSDLLHLMTTTPAFEFPRKNLPASVRYIGPLVWGPDTKVFVPPPWWDELLAHPRDKVIYVNHGYLDETGTISLPGVMAFADRSDLMIILHQNLLDTISYPPFKASSTCREKITLPSNARVASYLPHSIILPHVGVLIQYAEYINTLAALRCGVPMVCIGRSPSMLDVSSRVTWCGAGVELMANNPSEAEIRRAAFRVLQSCKYREAAEKVMVDFATHDPRKEGADELERVVGQVLSKGL
ncbi:PdmS protein [Thozetella sp. PMI_491]|nr:PdmS protein [Thozetella sp. PMI_491]